MADDIIIGIDLGSSAIRVALGRASVGENNEPRLHIIGAVTSPSNGIYRGAITSIEEAVSSLSKALERAERMTGVPLNSAYVGIGGTHIMVQDTRGAVAVSRPNAEIVEEDVERAIDAAKSIAIPANYAILHTIPKRFSVDGQRGIKDPVGMNGIKLEVDALVIETLASHYRNFTKTVARTGLDVESVIFGPLAAAEAVLSEKEKDLGVCLVNVGSSTTSLVIFEEGELVHTAVLPLGGDHITNDIAIGLRVGIDIAEQVKLRWGSALPDNFDRKEVCSLREFNQPGAEEVKRRFIAEIIEARLEEIFELIDSELRKIDRSGMLPVGAVVIGGGLQIDGALEVARRVLRLPASYGQLHDVSSVLDDIRDPAYCTAVGLARWAFEERRGLGRGGSFGKLFNFKSGGKMADHLRRWLSTFIP